MFVLGTGINQYHNLQLTLTSNASLGRYPDNRLSSFANVLPVEIRRGQDAENVYVRIRTLCVTSRVDKGSLDPDGRPWGLPLLYVRLEQLDTEEIFTSTLPALGYVDMRKSIADSRNTTYLFVTFDDAPYLRLRASSITQLNVRLTTLTGAPYPLLTGPPTVVQLEMSIMALKSEFTITCMSKPWGDNATLYPNNTVTNFKSKLTKSINLRHFEVALASIALPSFGGPNTLIQATLALVSAEEDGGYDAKLQNLPDDEKLNFSHKLNDFPSMVEFFGAFKQAVEGFAAFQNKIKLSYVADHEPLAGGWRIENQFTDKDLILVAGKTCAHLWGYTFNTHYLLIPAQQYLEPAQEYLPSKAVITNNEFHAYPHRAISVPEVCLLYSDMVSYTPFGDTTANLLGIVPLGSFTKSGENQGLSLYEPKHLIYYDIKDTDFNEIHFKLLRGDGSAFEITPTKKYYHMKQEHGAIITLRIRPKTLSDGSMPSTQIDPKPLLRVLPFNKRRFPHGPEGFA